MLIRCDNCDNLIELDGDRVCPHCEETLPLMLDGDEQRSVGKQFDEIFEVA